MPSDGFCPSCHTFIGSGSWPDCPECGAPIGDGDDDDADDDDADDDDDGGDDGDW